MRYPILLFDADNTLLDFDRSSREAFARTMDMLGVEPKDWYFDRYLQINRECWSMLEKGQVDPETVKWLRFSRFLEVIDVQADARDTGYYYLDRLSELSYLMEGATEVLADLHGRGFTLALITNGLTKVQRPRLAQSGLNDYFSAVVISEEIGVAKPMTGYFDHTLASLNSPSPEDVLIIGDNPGSDILGGQNMGIDTCWFNPRKFSFPFDPGPTHEVNHLTDIPELVTI